MVRLATVIRKYFCSQSHSFASCSQHLASSNFSLSGFHLSTPAALKAHCRSLTTVPSWEHQHVCQELAPQADACTSPSRRMGPLALPQTYSDFLSSCLTSSWNDIFWFLPVTVLSSKFNILWQLFSDAFPNLIIVYAKKRILITLNNMHNSRPAYLYEWKMVTSTSIYQPKWDCHVAIA